MASTYRISVLMGIYNCAPTLQEALDSLYAQTYQNFKIILCDDGSKDDTLAIAEENARVEDAKRAAAAKIDEIESQLKICIQALERIKEANRPAPVPAAPAAPAPQLFDFDKDSEKEEADSADAVADEIAFNLEALVGTTADVAPKAEPKHPTNDTTTSKFANLQFGRNYDPTGR